MSEETPPIFFRFQDEYVSLQTPKKDGRICGSRCLGPVSFLPEAKGQLITICQDGSLASRDTSSFKHGLAFLSRPVKVMEKIRIRIESRVSSWDGALRIGFTNNQPNANLIPPTSIPELRDAPRFCVTPVPEETCLPGAEIEFWLNSAAFLLIQKMDGSKYYLKAKGLNLTEPLYVFLDLYGSTSRVRLLGSRKGTRTSCPVLSADKPQFDGTTKEKGLEDRVLKLLSLFFNKNDLHSDRRDVIREDSTFHPSAVASCFPPLSPQASDPIRHHQTRGRIDLNRNLQSSMEEMDVTCLLREFQHQHLIPGEVHVIVWSKRVLESALNALSNSNFHWKKTPLIEFVGEMAVDGGGPKREFFRLLMIELQSSLGIFEGNPGHLVFTYDQNALQQHKYEQAGKLIAWSILHCGLGLKALDPCLFQLMCGQEMELSDFDWRLIPDADVQEKVQKVLNCRTNTHLHSLQRELGDWICECGFPGIYEPRISIQDIPRIYAFIVRHYIHLRVSNMIDQFTEGLNSYGRLWDIVKANWIDFLPVFTDMKEPLTRASFRALFQINWSREGTKRREKEEDTVYHWEVLLKMIEDKTTELHFKELLTFITATDDIPPLGFQQKPSINFYEPEKQGCRLPYASTCSMGLFLPRGVKSEAELNTLLLRAIRDSAGFGRV